MSLRSWALSCAIVTLAVAAAVFAGREAGAQPTVPPAAQFKVAPGLAQRTLAAPSAVKARLAALEAEGKTKGWTFPVAYTSVMDRSIEQITGEMAPSAAQIEAAPRVSAEAMTVTKLFRADIVKAGIKIPPLKLACNKSLAKWDWRAEGKVSPVKNQQCGDCWAFASAGQIESAMLMAGWTMQDMAEQHVLDCSNSGDCSGGQRWNALPWATGKAVSTETGYPYAGGVKKTCNAGATGPAQLVSANWIDSSGNVPSTAQLKEWLCEYGPFSVSIMATPALQAYGGGGAVFNETQPDNRSNHAIVLVGWDDSKNAWIMKNSWGVGWGDDGFGLVRYGANNIGKWPVVAVAPPPKFTINPVLAGKIANLRAMQVLDLPRPPVDTKIRAKDLQKVQPPVR